MVDKSKLSDGRGLHLSNIDSSDIHFSAQRNSSLRGKSGTNSRLVMKAYQDQPVTMNNGLQTMQFLSNFKP
eukprot:CAMPEP_0170509856 /NCGR_PEP_ID=MMETSP0208-20121228/65443_1 /TAXON_ID=197538 /ORGANISM="Strombidium inclinatum, Strain S3" /LENGTH=70 /DNA_ID=CAMNT_0010793255 /DNA_START=1135 /DNA_END=1347 /DNA_ORIENTATION=-